MSKKDLPSIPETPAGVSDPRAPAFPLATGSAISRWHWLWMAPVAITLSPIGWIAGTAYFRLSFVGSLQLAGALTIGVVILGALSNWGE